MSAVETISTLTWRMELGEGGITIWTLYDEIGRRWAWCVRMKTEWACHTGDWGWNRHRRLPPLPSGFGQELVVFPTAAAGREWAEEYVAAKWAELS